MDRICNFVSNNSIDIPLDYTKRQLEILNSIKFINHCGRVLEINSDNLWKYTTKIGIEFQINQILENSGIVYFVSFDGDTPTIRKEFIKLEHRG